MKRYGFLYFSLFIFSVTLFSEKPAATNNNATTAQQTVTVQKELEPILQDDKEALCKILHPFLKELLWFATCPKEALPEKTKLIRDSLGNLRACDHGESFTIYFPRFFAKRISHRTIYIERVQGALPQSQAVQELIQITQQQLRYKNGMALDGTYDEHSAKFSESDFANVDGGFHDNLRVEIHYNLLAKFSIEDFKKMLIECGRLKKKLFDE